MVLTEKLLGSSSAEAEPLYVEDVFSTYLYTGTSATQSIVNDIDLSTEGGLVWIKARTSATNHFLFDTERGVAKELNSNTTDAETSLASSLTSFNTDGFTIGSAAGIGTNAINYVSWTFRKAPKFFDVVTYTGTGVSGLTVSHNLGSVPGFIIVKRLDDGGVWWAYHRSLGATKYLVLSNTDASGTASSIWNDTEPTSTNFTVGDFSSINTNGATYVAYLFAHDAGGFGDDGTENIISCGSYTGNGSADGPVINLGYEPQFILTKSSSIVGNWVISDNMRGTSTGGDDEYLLPNSAGAAAPQNNYEFNATGFKLTTTNTLNSSGETYIYIAIRRGPMKTPTDATKVFVPQASGNNATAGTLSFNSTFPVDMLIQASKGIGGNFYEDRMRGLLYLDSTSTAAEAGSNDSFATQTGILCTSAFNYSGRAGYMFRRAPGFFDVVAYTGTGSARTVSHNLGVAPELIIVKKRSGGTARAWAVYANNDNTDYLVLNTTAATADSNTYWNDTSPTSTVFTVGTANSTNENTFNYIAYLFATCPGVSKVGSYTGSGTTKQIDCGFTAGARFVMIKRVDNSGDWYFWDSARGIVAGNDPYLLMNSTAAEVTNTDYVDTYGAGFEISSTAPDNINENDSTFIFLAIA
jgi:hypothetical protein